MPENEEKPYKRTNEEITITIGPPLLRPGMNMSATVSDAYAVPTALKMMDKAREINRKEAERRS